MKINLAFQKRLHSKITKAIIETVEEHKDQPSLYKDILQYWQRANETIKLGLSFCPPNDLLINILEAEANHD